MSGAKGPGAAPALPILRLRSEFLAAARARRQAVAGFLLQARRREPDEGGAGARVGFTCSKKVGNAVTRNRAKRRLRALAREVLAGAAVPGWDYVLIGRPTETVSRPYDLLRQDLVQALAAIHAPPKAPRRAPEGPSE